MLYNRMYDILYNADNLFRNGTQFRPGLEGLKLYSQIHGNNTNQIIHALGMPVVAYAIFGLSNLHLNTASSILIYLFYFFYYASFDIIGSFCSLLLFFPSLCSSMIEYYDFQHYYDLKYNTFIYDNKKLKMTKYYIKMFLLSVVIQEFVGHFIYEKINSDLFQLPNSITQAPLFATRALLHNLFNLPLIPN